MWQAPEKYLWHQGPIPLVHVVPWLSQKYLNSPASLENHTWNWPKLWVVIYLPILPPTQAPQFLVNPHHPITIPQIPKQIQGQLCLGHDPQGLSSSPELPWIPNMEIIYVLIFNLLYIIHNLHIPFNSYHHPAKQILWSFCRQGNQRQRS